MKQLNESEVREVVASLDYIASILGTAPLSEVLKRATETTQASLDSFMGEHPEVTEEERRQFLREVPKQMALTMAGVYEGVKEQLAASFGDPQKVADLLKKTWDKQMKERDDGNTKL